MMPWQAHRILLLDKVHGHCVYSYSKVSLNSSAPSAIFACKKLWEVLEQMPSFNEAGIMLVLPSIHWDRLALQGRAG